MKINMRYFLVVLCLCVATSVHAEEICIIDRPSIVERIENRTYPSVFGAWNHELINYPKPDSVWEWSYLKDMRAHFDLFWGGENFRGVQFRFTSEESHLVSLGGLEHGVYERNEVQKLNPNHLLLASLYYYGAHPETYPEDWPYWLRDEEGNRIQDEGWKELLIDYTHPGAQDHFVQRAIAIAQCGIFDGIFLDWWAGEDREDTLGEPGTADLYHSNTADARISLLRRIREAVGDDFLIIANTTTHKVPRSAPYLNGAFMETFGNYSREHVIEIENALSWYEENFRYPQVNCLQAVSIPNEPLNSPRNQQWARMFTALSLTHSNGYVWFHGQYSYSYWYNFWDTDLGHLVGGDETKRQLYENREGLFIREFTNGWAVYNRSGKAQEVEFPEVVSGVASGVTEKRLHVLPDLDGEIYLKSESQLETSPTADINGDGVVNVLDLVLVANALGEEAPDLNGDGIVNILDLVIVANAFE